MMKRKYIVSGLGGGDIEHHRHEEESDIRLNHCAYEETTEKLQPSINGTAAEQDERDTLDGSVVAIDLRAESEVRRGDLIDEKRA